MIMPNFLVIGAAKAGTTSLYKYLEQHPDLYMSSFKEPGFFAFEGEKPVLNGPGAQKWVDRWVTTDLFSYQQLFKEYTGQKAIGEASSYYLYYHDKVPFTIKKYVPNVKLIVILRDPVDRAFSNYVWAVRDRAEPIADFSEALSAENGRILDNWGVKWRYLDQGFYCRQLQPYYERFNRDRIKVCLYEDLISNPVGLIQDIFSFLDIDNTFVPDISRKHNKSLLPRNKAWHQFLTKPNAVKSLLKPFLPVELRQYLQKTATAKNLFKPQLTPGIRQKLVKQYREDILQLQDLIDRDLSSWLKYQH